MHSWVQTSFSGVVDGRLVISLKKKKWMLFHEHKKSEEITFTYKWKLKNHEQSGNENLTVTKFDLQIAFKKDCM